MLSSKEAKINPLIEEEPTAFITLFQRKKNTGEMGLLSGICCTLIMLGINKETPFIPKGPITSPYTQP